MSALALFDLDDTLLSGDSEVLWGEFLVAQGVLGADFAARNAEMDRLYRAGEVEPAVFCEFFAGTLAGRSAPEWQPLHARFMRDVLVPRIPAGARELVDGHRAKGDVCVLTSASGRFLVERVAAELGFAHFIATELQTDADARFSGHTVGVPNMREGKVARLHDWLRARGQVPEREMPGAFFYSDSINDLPLLRAVGCPVAVDPDARLLREAEARRWPVLRLARHRP